ncbi:MAG TPA: NADH-quinone oxidoreductase subunit J [Gemmatimonadales bacterium]|jgi:NADH-quinone oxidoreductase subunit J|nr:NADH-quinone oxidoreductase subunit J [Gemmatimonadales bacterium]
MTQFVFYLFAFAAVLGGAMCILQRNPAVSAIWLMSTMFSLAAIYVLLGAELIGILQILVYVGAILVVFLFVIMLLNLTHASTDMRGPGTLAAAIVIVGLLVVELAALWQYTPRRLAADLAQAPGFADPGTAFAAGELTRQATAAQGVVGALATPLFQTYLVPFEITSILLLAAIIGAVVLAKRRI